MNHPSREQLAAFLSGMLDDAVQDAVSAHVAACDACCAVLGKIPEDPFVVQLRGGETPCMGRRPPTAVLSDSSLLPIEVLDHPKYKIGRYLGAGGMGAVFQAEHRLMDRVVALKIIHSHLSRRPRVVQRFRQEVRAAGRLSHPNIVAAYDAEQAGDVHFLVMEYVDGLSLDRLIAKNGPLETAHACYFIRQAAKGLQHAYEKGMVHRDLKPQNLMLNRKGQVKILDFGLARIAEESHADLAEFDAGPDEATKEQAVELTRIGDIVGTPDYMAPEQAFDSSMADVRSDIYSLGCTLYFLLSGKTPFGGMTARQKVLAKRHDRPTPVSKWRSDLPAELVGVMERMLAPEPDERYPTPAQVVKALARFARPGPAAAPEPVVAKKPSVPVVEPPAATPDAFQARCPFCRKRMRIPRRGQGQSLPCLHCGSFFTAAPEESS